MRQGPVRSGCRAWRRRSTASGEGAGAGERVVFRCDAADQLDQPHHRHRVHEVHAHELARPIGHRRKSCDGDRRSVGCKQHIRWQANAHLLEDIAFYRLVLRCCLNNEVAIGERREIGVRRNPPQRRVFFFRADHASTDLAVHVAADIVHALFEARLVDIIQTDVEAFECADMGDAAAHLAGTDYADALDHDGYPWGSGYYFFSTAAVSSGTIWKRSPTIP